MDGWDRNDPSPERASARTVTVAPAAGTSRVEDGETIFTIIAARARGHSISHLILTAAIGLIDAAAIAWAHPAFWPAALLLGAAGAYGAWGLLDRAVEYRSRNGLAGGATTMGVRVLREMVALVGVAAVIAAVGGLFATQFDGWIH